jgi:uncharacterized protein
MEILAGFFLGLLGSFHCVGMCGPLALALPYNTGSNFVLSRLVYNSGRIITYSMLGLLFGVLGAKLDMIGLQQIISISLGVFILLVIFLPRSYKASISGKLGLYKLIGVLKSSLSKMFKKHSGSSMLGIGILNGLLPCGFVYIAVSGAIAIGDAGKSMMFMALFGLGTLPVMLGVSLIGTKINITLRQRLTRLVPVFSVLLALIFILRGLNLGIPYVSPKLENKTAAEEINCH